jgi:hypothetical protein
MFGIFRKNKILVTFIDKKWNEIATKVRIVSVPSVGELVYFGVKEEYYRVTQVINWPNQNPSIFIVIESLSDVDRRYTKITKRIADENNGNS